MLKLKCEKILTILFLFFLFILAYGYGHKPPITYVNILLRHVTFAVFTLVGLSFCRGDNSCSSESNIVNCVIYGKCSKILNTFLFLLLNKMLQFTKCFTELYTGKTRITLLYHKWSDVGLHCLSMPFW